MVMLGESDFNPHAVAALSPYAFSALAARQRTKSLPQIPKHLREVEEKPQPGHRTQEQIEADLEARMAELEKEAERREADAKKKAAADLISCRRCRWSESRDRDGTGPYICTEPLIKGFKARPLLPTVADYKGEDVTHRPKLCGPEKALWSPQPTTWERYADKWNRFKAWFISPFIESKELPL